MAILLSAHQLSKQFSARPLFTGLTFSVETGERVGLIGPNGAGKSTLLKILAGQTQPDGGTLSLQRGLRVGLLEQDPSFEKGATVMSALVGHDDDWELHASAQEQIARLELGDPETPVERLSGGWKKRVALARELVRKPDLLLLDEPTNHLDVESILWLESLLARAPFAAVTITHDRLFLQRVSNRIMELDPRHAGGLLSVAGDYAAYLEVRGQLIQAQERREVILRNTLRRETEWLRRGAKARTTKQQARIQRHGELSETVEDLNTRNQVRSAAIEFQGAEKNPKKLLEARGLGKHYGDKRIFSGLDLMIRPGSRIGILGPNGCGKSSMIRTLLGEEPPTAGTVARSEHLSVAYFDQVRAALNPEITVAKTLCPVGDFVDYRGGRTHIRSYLDRFLFTQQQMDMPVGRLSGGEQSRILVARLMLTPANLLVLDEPTNDLDMATLGVLEECLEDFPGAVLLVTHDRYFLDQVADQILAFQKDGSLIAFEGLSQWETWRANQGTARAVRPAGSEGATSKGKKKLSYKDQRELETIEPAIHAAEERLTRLTKEAEDPALASDAVKLAKLTQEMSEAQSEIERLFMRWSELSS